MVRRKERFQNIGAGKGIKDRLTPDILRELYVAERLTQTEIARRYRCTPQFISLLLKEYGIQRQPGS